MTASSNPNANPTTTTYDAGHIEVLEGLAAVRERPGMYIGSTGERGLHHMVFELLGHAAAEVSAGHADTIGVTLTADGGVRVADNGRGLPVEAELTELRAGGRYGSGLHGIGISVVNALSSRLTTEVRRDGFRWTQEYESGVALTPPVRQEETTEHGTAITFWADADIFTGTEYCAATLSRRFQELAFLHRGLSISLTDERPVRHSYEHGARDFVTHLNSGSEPLHPTVIVLEANANADEDVDMEVDVSVEIALQWNTSRDENVRSFVNATRTQEGGSHEDGLRSALTAVLTTYARHHRLLPEEGLPLTDADIREGLTAVLSAKLANPRFEGATRGRLSNPEVGALVQEAIHTHLPNWLAHHPHEAAAVIGKAGRAAAAARRSGSPLRIAVERAFDPEEMFELYDSVEWEGYTVDVDKLCRGLANSHLVITARDASGALLGLARTISDDESVCYVQDLLVNPRHHRRGIGRALLEHLKERYAHCRFFLLSTDHEATPEGKKNAAFYRSLGFLSYEEKQMAAFGLPRVRPAQP
ncbi:GNAT family N-acetyltransferase [Streptomyces sp. NBC_01565]|uniref:GNAT family N-acetyltransferase n=1 Tax=Streptomyces sp. NBC_01565 TaxID=2975881 RepID=UPI00225C10CE|nr:GNAT family N-acetyltransferase [Streptomyces sp. NBC_01565]MCX4545932.1 GNAT family N-acetyltransferase [Streptomyces sp. NBC_01565]